MTGSLGEASSLAYFQRMGSPIAAIATAAGGPIGIVRVSGANLRALEACVGPLPDAGHFAYREIRDPRTQRVLDRALLLFFRAPRSYTGEDVLELQTHGVPDLLNKILELLQHLGAQPALPGEFTFRAVMNEKMTLTEAEGLQTALSTEGIGASWASKLLGVGAAGDATVQSALSQLTQDLSTARGRVEAAIDFPEAEGEQDADVRSSLAFVARARESMSHLLSGLLNFSRSAGEARVGIVGAPNVGKSTLLNVLSGGERALVSPVAGTTRDVVEAKVRLPSGRWLRFFDTAGVHEADAHTDHERLERAGMSWGLRAAEEAALIVHVRRAHEAELAAPPAIQQLSPPRVDFYSHGDLASGSAVVAFDFRDPDSGLRQEVLRKVEQALDRSSLQATDFDLVISGRQGQLLELALAELDQAEESLQGRRPLELAGHSLRKSEEWTRQALGQGLSEDYIGEIFRQFCLGK